MLPGLSGHEHYYHMPEKTAETIDSEGWLHSGDLATMNERGYVNIVGRLKDMVIRGGENILPAPRSRNSSFATPRSPMCRSWAFPINSLAKSC